MLIAATTLYVCTAVLLLLNLDGHPDYAYNWEAYTAWDVFPFLDGDRPLIETLHLTDGLMTDSGESPFTVFPIWLSFKLFGVNLYALRFPIALIAALAVPMAYLLGKQVISTGAGLFAAVALAISPTFLLYGRTGTLVGMSVGFALLTAYALLRVIQTRHTSLGRRIVWLVTLQVMLIANSYLYAPIRFLWPIALVLLLVELIFQRDHRGWFLSSLALTLLVLPAFLTVMLGQGWSVHPQEWSLKSAVTTYYNGRGEQLVNLVDEPIGFQYYLDGATQEEVVQRETTDLAWSLIRQNAEDYLYLFIDWDTRPTITDYYNSRGQLYDRLLLPVFVLGLVGCVVGFFRRPEARFLLAGFFGFSLPMILTSKVHVGRLVFALPFLMLIAALGFLWLTRALLVWIPRFVGWLGRTSTGTAGPRLSTIREIAQAVLAAVLLLVVADETRSSFLVEPNPSESREETIAVELGHLAAQGADAIALVLADDGGIEIEAINVATYRLRLDDEYRFVNVATGLASPERANDDRPVVYVGGLADQSPDTGASGLPNDGCGIAYLVQQDLVEQFQPFLSAVVARCGPNLIAATLPF